MKLSLGLLAVAHLAAGMQSAVGRSEVKQLKSAANSSQSDLAMDAIKATELQAPVPAQNADPVAAAHAWADNSRFWAEEAYRWATMGMLAKNGTGFYNDSNGSDVANTTDVDTTTTTTSSLSFMNYSDAALIFGQFMQGLTGQAQQNGFNGQQGGLNVQSSGPEVPAGDQSYQNYQNYQNYQKALSEQQANANNGKPDQAVNTITILACAMAALVLSVVLLFWAQRM